MSLKDFQIVSKLGDGAYSTVYKVTRFEDNQTYALKRVKIVNLSPKQKQNALNQIRILASIRHPNVVCYKQAFIDQASKSLCIVMQFANHGDLSNKITDCQKNNQFLPQQEIWNIFLQTVKGLKQLHDLNIFHRDIKPANIFLHDNNVAKLGDMNVSKVTETGLCMTQTGTPYYASPEVWKDQPYDEKSDIWSLGCVLYELITLKPPFRGEDMQALYKKVIRGIYPRIPSQYSNDLSTMIRLLLQVNPEQRPSCQKILSMPVVIKRLKNVVTDGGQKAELLKTIKAASNFYSITDQLPKANYQPMKVRKTKGIKSLIDSIQEKQMCEVQSLPMLQKQKKIVYNYQAQNSDRYLLKQKHSINMLQRQRKKSQISSSSRGGLQINGINYKCDLMNINKQLKLPKVQNRYKAKQKIPKQNSLRNHKIYQ